MYKLIIYIYILFIVFERSRCNTLTCKDIESKSATLRLKRHLFCDYDTTVRPSISVHSTLNIQILFIPKFVEFYEYRNSLDFHTWLILIWDDVHLKWNPDDFEHAEQIHIKSDEIWVPDFSVFNSGDLSLDQSSFPTTDCILQYNGTIQCAVARVFTTHCPADFANWPYDKHNCTLHFGSWMHFGDEINFQYEDNGVFMHEFVQNHEWDVKISKLVKSSELYRTSLDYMIFMNVQIERRPTRSSLIYITPAIVLMILTLTSLWLDPCSIERTAVASTNFMCHLLCIYDLHWYLPSSGANNSPKILIFYEASIAIAAFTFIFTCFLRKVHGIVAPPPQWISSTVFVVLNSPVTQYIGVRNLRNRREARILNESENNEETSSKKDDIWQECAGILEWVGFVTVFCTYVILLIVLVPTSDPNMHMSSYVF